MGKLVLFLADGTTLDIPLDRERMRIGRRPGTDLCLPYAAVSGEHAVIVASASGTTIEDLGSTNGTLVNDRPIARHRLADGDRIDIGRQQLVYVENNLAIAPIAGRRHGPASRWRREELSGGSAQVVPGEADTVRLDEGDPAQSVGTAVVVVSGPSSGRVLRLTRPESLVGRVGVQVAAIRAGEGGYRVFAVEGDTPPRVNGMPVRPEGATLRTGDEIEVAGGRLRFSTA